MTEPEEFMSLKGVSIPRKISVEYISFSAHVDYSQNSEFIELVKAQHVVCPSDSVLILLSTRSVGFGTRRTNGNGSVARCYDIPL